MSTETDSIFKDIDNLINDLHNKVYKGIFGEKAFARMNKKAARKAIRKLKKLERAEAKAEAKAARKAKRAAFYKKVKAKVNNNKVKSSVIGLSVCFVFGALYGVFKK